ncbi:DNA cytosine methyltransferase, partial [Gammaproteobacteria bacterium]|nr:DNA cytosine methyltransferase [Gammaproteobacteria bacterium]
TKQLSKKYYLFERLTNAIEAGAPQDRDRILLFGAKKTVFKENTFDWEENLIYSNSSVVDHDWIKCSPYGEKSHLPPPNNIPLELTVQYWFNANDIKNHPNQIDCFTPRAGLKKFKIIEEGDVSKKSYKRLHRWRYSPTAAYGNNEVHLHPFESRRISVAEALAIQSMPKDFVLPPNMTLTNKFKTIGNGVPYLLARAVAKSIRRFISENHIEK